MAILRVREAFSFLSDPTGYVYAPGKLLDTATDADVIKRAPRGSLEPLEDYMAPHGRTVEQATAEPGGKRTRSRARVAAPAEPVTPEPEVAEVAEP